MTDIAKKKLFSLVVLIGFIVLGVTILHRYQGEIRLPRIGLEQAQKDKKYEGMVHCSFISNIGNRNHLKVEISIPCYTREQKIQLKKKMENLQSDFIIRIDPMELKGWVQKRNFEAIKNNLLMIINRHTDKPIKKVYFDTFLYQ